MKRREFITLLGGAAAVWPLTARAQSGGKVYRIGYFSAGTAIPHLRNVFHDALGALGWIEGKNVVYEYRYADNQLDRLPELAAELVRLNVRDQVGRHLGLGGHAPKVGERIWHAREQQRFLFGHGRA
jgi:putative ABC transport system substrate-binding protein